MFNRSAVFVDAGYLFAAGSALLAGSKQPRHLISVDENAVVSALSVRPRTSRVFRIG